VAPIVSPSELRILDFEIEFGDVVFVNRRRTQTAPRVR
jgi:hypothetical protein